jgi:hypothetical protein
VVLADGNQHQAELIGAEADRRHLIGATGRPLTWDDPVRRQGLVLLRALSCQRI